MNKYIPQTPDDKLKSYLDSLYAKSQPFIRAEVELAIKSDAAKEYHQSLMPVVDIEKLKEEFNYACDGRADRDGIWNVFLPYLQPKQESDAIQLIKQLLLFCETDGTVVNGFKTREVINGMVSMLKTKATQEYQLPQDEVKIVFILDGQHRSPEYTPMELLNKDETDITADTEGPCTCSINESNNHCDGSCTQFENSEITGYEIVGHQPSQESDAIELLRKIRVKANGLAIRDDAAEGMDIVYAIDAFMAEFKQK